MWLQAVAIVLPRLQDEFGVGTASVGFASSATFAGMMVGALAWGACEWAGRSRAPAAASPHTLTRHG